MDQDNLNDNYINYTSQVGSNVNPMTLSSYFSNLNNNTNENDVEDDMPSLVSVNPESLFNYPFISQTPSSFITASNMLTQIQQMQSSLYFNNVNSYISNSNIHPQLHNTTTNMMLTNYNHYINNSNINSQLSGPVMMNNYLNHYINNTLPINNPNINNFINNNIYPFNMAHQENILGLNGMIGINGNMINGPSNNIMMNGVQNNFNQPMTIHGMNGPTMFHGNTTIHGPFSFQGNTTIHGSTGSNGPTMFHGNTTIHGSTGSNGPTMFHGNTTIHGPSGSTGSNAPMMYGASGSNMSMNINLNNKTNHKLSFVDDNFYFISNCVDKNDISKGILYKFKFKKIKLEFILKINESNGKPIYNKKFLKMIQIIESIINNMNVPENIRSICNIIYHKDYYIILSIKSKINIVI